ncbi:arginine--tRNA ligase, partial [Candidatus Saccharibacteria bacterium]|nr:arginine--tRNA ligase [Candidatus Saccharibacteria bacterium]
MKMLQLETYLKERINTALQKRHFPQSDYQFDRPKLAKHGDISVNLAMILAKLLKQNPRQVAEEIVDQLDLDSQRIEKIEIAGPGFINFFIAKPELHNAVSKILESGNDYGKFDIGASKKAMVEFVSANPTGPLTVGHGRQAVIGDTIANLYEWLGYEVTREYYFNNAGRQMRVLAESVKLRYLELLGHKIQFPEDYYQGQYIQNIAVKIGE